MSEPFVPNFGMLELSAIETQAEWDAAVERIRGSANRARDNIELALGYVEGERRTVVDTDDARAALFHLEVFAEGEDSKRIRVVIEALARLTAIEQAAQKVLDDIDDCRSANKSVANLRTTLATTPARNTSQIGEG